MDRVGIIDIDLNSLRLVLIEINKNGYFRIIDELKTPIDLDFSSKEDYGFYSKNFNTIISTLRAYKSLCTVSGANKIYAIATESLRDREYKDIFLSHIKKDIDIDIRVLTCEEEMYYNFLGVIKSMYIKNSLLVQVSRKQTHLIWVKDNKIMKTSTLNVGSIDFTCEFDLNDRILPTSITGALEYLSDTFESVSWLKETDFESIIGISSIIRNVGKIDKARKKYPYNIIHNYELTDIDVKEVFNLLKSKDFKQRKKIEGIEPSLANTIVGGTAIFKKIANTVNCSKVIVSDRGLREGLIYEYLSKKYTIPDDILDYSISGILDSLNGDKNHAENVFKISYFLYESLKSLHHLGDEFYNIIKTSTMLHDCGTSINYYEHHKHSFYIITNSSINGLTHKEILMSASIAASHRFNNYQTPIARFSAILNQLDLKIINYIGVLVKIAEGLDRSLVGAVKNLDVSIDDESVTIYVFSDIDVDFEIRQALRAKDTFKEIYNKNLIIQASK